MHAGENAVICWLPEPSTYSPRGVRLRQQGRTVRAARSSQCPCRCAPSPPPAWESWEACSLGLPSHQQPARRAGSCEWAWNRTWAVQWWWVPVVVRRRCTLTTARRLVMEIRCGIEKLGVACFLPREGIGSRLLAAQVVSDPATVSRWGANSGRLDIRARGTPLGVHVGIPVIPG
jgi:hypothetical protein